MVKRFVDTDLWQKEWFQELSIKHKILVKYLFENCDCAGVWTSNFKMASFLIGETVTIEDLREINEHKEQFEEIEKGKIFVVDYIQFQYGTLSESCKPHKAVIEKLKKYNLFERVSKGYPKGIDTLQYKYNNNTNINTINNTINNEEENQKLYGEYNNVCLSEKQYNKLLGMCLSDKLLNELIDALSGNIAEGKEKNYSAEYPNVHYERLRKYYNYRKTHPEQFKEEESTQDIIARVCAEMGV